MALAIRLARGGMKKRPYYRIVVTDSRNARDGKFIEKIGTYNPLLPKDSAERIKLDTDRAAHWLSVGAQPSDRVARFLDAAGVRTREARSQPEEGRTGRKGQGTCPDRHRQGALKPKPKRPPPGDHRRQGSRRSRCRCRCRSCCCCR